ncbi:hypothetical protein BDF14DRAFT_1812363 [Spinellus fusiger]|nr:hypothetical protein BDF14DRAFT_1812308 [Spinellus fusiger]KAI7866532.1 hypothetical protein BDF14DRAFT_1812363 [Spinellus fusiger]
MKKSKEEITAAKKETIDQIRKVNLAVSSRRVEDISGDSLSEHSVEMIRNLYDL